MARVHTEQETANAETKDEYDARPLNGDFDQRPVHWMIILGLTVFFVLVVAIVQTMQTDYYSNNVFFTALVVQWIAAIILIIFLAWWFFRKPKPEEDEEEQYGGVVPGDQSDGNTSPGSDKLRKLMEDNERLADDNERLGKNLEEEQEARKQDAEKMAKLEADLERLGAKLEDKTKRHDDQVEEAKKMQQNLLELEDLLAKERERAKARKTKKGLEDTESQLELEQKLGEMLEAKNKQLEEELEQARQENEELKQKLKDQEEQDTLIGDLEGQVEGLKSENKNLEDQMALLLDGGIANEDAGKVKDLQEQLAACEKAHVDLEDQLKASQADKGGDKDDGAATGAENENENEDEGSESGSGPNSDSGSGTGVGVAVGVGVGAGGDAGELTLLELAKQLTKRSREEGESSEGYVDRAKQSDLDAEEKKYPDRSQLGEEVLAQLVLVREELHRILGASEEEMEAHDLRDALEDLKQQLIVQNDHLEDSERERERLVKELADWKQLLENTDQTEQEIIKELEETVQELQTKLNKLKEENLKELEEDNQHLRDLVAALEKEKANLEAQLEESSTKEVERITITERIETLVHEVETREITIHELEQVIITLKEEKVILMEKLDNGESAQSAELELQLKEAMQRIQDLETELQAKDEYMQSAKAQCDKDKQRLQEEVDSLREQLEAVDSEAKEAREKEIQEAYQTYMSLKPQLGIEIVDTKKSRGVLIVNVKPGRSGDLAGAKEGDVISDVDGYEVRNRKDFRTIFKKHVFAGEIVPFEIVRDRKIHRTLTFPVGAPGYSVEEVQRLRALVAHLLPDKKGVVAMPG